MKNNNSKSKIDLKHRSYHFSLNIITLIDQLNQKDFSIQVISKQLLRSATSIGANIIEAQAGTTKRDFTSFLSHALKSANETKFWLALLKDSHKATPTQIDQLLQEATELANILASSILTLKGKNKF